MKQCIECLELKEDVMFDYTSKDKINRRSRCRKCRNEKNLGSYKEKKKKEYKYYITSYIRRMMVIDINYVLYSRIMSRIRNAFNNKKDKYLVENYNYTKLDLINHIENQFIDGMTWENKGTYWEIDHIIPVLGMLRRGYKEEEINSLDNLRPLKCSENRSRSKKWDKEIIEFYGK